MKTFDRVSLTLLAALVVGLGYSGGTAHAQSPVGTVSNIPAPAVSAKAFSTSLRYDSSGNLYAWDGLNVWMQSGSGGFSEIGSVADAGNQADAGPIVLSQDQQSLLLSNGAGGKPKSATYNGVFWTLPASGGTGRTSCRPRRALRIRCPGLARHLDDSRVEHEVYRQRGKQRLREQFAVDFRRRDRHEQGGHRRRPRRHDFDRHQSKRQQRLRRRRFWDQCRQHL